VAASDGCSFSVKHSKNTAQSYRMFSGQYLQSIRKIKSLVVSGSIIEINPERMHWSLKMTLRDGQVLVTLTFVRT
jgi:acyl-CoA thioesterase FadM